MSDQPSKIEPRLLKGFRDILPAQMLSREQMIASISQTLELYGFSPLETPALEYADILLGKLGDEGEKLLYQFTDHGGRQVAMRYDFTVPLARVAAQYPDLPKPFKRYQVGPVWRADNTQRGRYREFYQFDMDIVGSDSLLADAEILVLMQQILKKLGVNEFVIRINDRQAMQQAAHSLDINDHQLQVFFTGLDKLDKIGPDGVLEYWHSHDFNVFNDDNFVAKIEQAAGLDSPGSRLNQVIALAEKLGLEPQYFRKDASIVRGLDYYTGTVFETNLKGAEHFGSVLSGGRYDGLIGRFAKQPIPAVGTSVGVDRLLAALEELRLTEPISTSTHVFITIFSEELLPVSLDLTKQLRGHGIATQMSFETSSLGRQLKSAAAQGIPYAVIIGPDEAKAHQATLRDLRTGEEQKLDYSSLIRHLSA